MTPDHVGGRKLRVLHVILHVNQTNGQYNEHVLPLVEAREISVCSYFTPRLEPPSGVRLYSGEGRLLHFLGAMRTALARDNDVIHVHAPQTGSLVVLALLASFRLRRYRKAMVYTVQDSWYDYSFRNQLLMLVALAGFKRVIFCSRSAYESLPRPWRWLVRGRWRVVQNAADIDRVDRALVAKNARDSSNGDFKILFVGRLEPVKDTDTLLRSFARVADDQTKLIMVGAGSLESEVAEQIATLGLEDSVTMTGLIPRDDVFRLCADADVLVSTSHGEGLPVAVIEAMAARCPVVLSDIPPHRELLDGEDFVQFVALGDEEGFARAIQTVKSMSKLERGELGERARRHVIDRYSLPIMHHGTEAVYRELQNLEFAGSRSVQ